MDDALAVLVGLRLGEPDSTPDAVTHWVLLPLAMPLAVDEGDTKEVALVMVDRE